MFVGAAVLLAGALLGPSAAQASAPRAPSPAPVVAGGGYLALGDSVSFGYRGPGTYHARTTPTPPAFPNWSAPVSA
ncbi:MAG: hypothetical protein ACYDEN_08165 [Acidimicrobiales bacterium]